MANKRCITLETLRVCIIVFILSSFLPTDWKRGGGKKDWKEKSKRKRLILSSCDSVVCYDDMSIIVINIMIGSDKSRESSTENWKGTY